MLKYRQGNVYKHNCVNRLILDQLFFVLIRGLVKHPLALHTLRRVQGMITIGETHTWGTYAFPLIP